MSTDQIRALREENKGLREERTRLIATGKATAWLIEDLKADLGRAPMFRRFKSSIDISIALGGYLETAKATTR